MANKNNLTRMNGDTLDNPDVMAALPAAPVSPYEAGAAVIRAVVKTLPETPGVYRMLNARDEPLYVGKAKALKRRVHSYTQFDRLTLRLRRMVAETKRMEIIHTHTEIEALLLEANLIKKLRPHYNILLKDDKSFPYIHITAGHDFPQLTKHRGVQGGQGDYFGPFASVFSVNKTITALQKAFLLRNCSDSIFATRTRPCLQYHIKRCSAPCVGFVSPAQYAAQIDEARQFLNGKSRDVVDGFASEMQKASDALDFERAARLRDRIRALAHVQLQQDVNVASLGDADVFAVVRSGGMACVQVFFFRAGQNFGNRSYFPRVAEEDTEGAILAAFLPQFYAPRPAPRAIILSHAIEAHEAELITGALQTLHKLSYRITITVPKRGDAKRVIDFVERNAHEALQRHKIERASDTDGLSRMQEIFDLPDLPQRIEVYDNSHTQGAFKVGGMIVAGPEGFRKQAYRTFNIKSTEAGDDIAMMREVLTRRLSRAVEAGQVGEPETWPDVLLIDGGPTQLAVVLEVTDALGVTDDLTIIAISKGPDRNAGREWFHRRDHAPFQLPIDDVGLRYMQRLRDEAHRFAIGAHRNKRGRGMVASSLDDIPAIGPTRKKALLSHFGSGKAVERAGLADLEAVPGISRAVAQKIYDHFNGS